MRTIFKALILSLAIVIGFASCAGAKGYVRLTDLNYPASMTSYLYGKDMRILKVGRELKSIEDFKFTKSFWGMVYTQVTLSDDKDLTQAMNKAIEDAGAIGITDVSVQVGSASLNQIPGALFIPFWPGKAIVSVTGILVKMAE